MKHLLLFTYFVALLYTAACYTTVFDLGNPRDGLLQQVVPGSQQQSSFARIPRQNRFSSNGNIRPNPGGFNWGASGNNVIDVPSPDNIIFDDANNFNIPNIPDRPNINGQGSRPATTRRPTSSTVAIPGMATTRSPCEDRCRATTQYDPVCGDNNVTYTNMNWLKCAQRCGRNVNVRYIGACPRVP